MVEDTGIVARFLTNPVAVLLAAAVLAMLVGARAAFGHVSGGGLSPAPEPLARLVVAAARVVARARARAPPCPAPPYVLPMALLATLLGGSPAAAVSALLVLAVPFSLWGAWRFLRVVGRLATPAGATRWLILWGATTYALVPVVTGAWGEGRLGAGRSSAALLPWLGARRARLRRPGGRPALARGLAHRAAARPGQLRSRRWPGWSPPLGRRGRGACSRSRCCPASAGTARSGVRRSWRSRVVPVLLAPWWLPALLHGAGRGAAARHRAAAVPTPDGVDLGLGRFHDLGAPWWLGVVLPVLAAARAGAAPDPDPGADLLGRRAARGPGGRGARRRSRSTWPRCPRRPASASCSSSCRRALVTAVVLGALGIEPAARCAPGRSRSLLVAVAVAAPLGGLAWFVADGGDHLTDDRDTDIPAYMVQSSELGPEHGILVVRGRVDDGLTYTVRRDDGVTIGEDEVLDLTAEDHELHRRWCRRWPPGRPRTPSTSWPRAGIEYVVLPAPADGDVAAGARRHRPGWSRPAPRTAPPAPGRSTGRCRRATSTGHARGCGSCCWSLQGLAILVVARAVRADDRPGAREGGRVDEAPVRGRRDPGGRCCRWSARWRCCSCTRTAAQPHGEAPGRDAADLRVGGLPGAAARHRARTCSA